MKPVMDINRPDPEIFAEARRTLDERPTIPATVRVHVDHGLVILTGSVRLASQRSEAEEVVRHVAGVRHVVNDIVVGEPPSAAGFEAPGE
jgi:osmotically-inducible protein OsmY